MLVPRIVQWYEQKISGWHYWVIHELSCNPWITVEYTAHFFSPSVNRWFTWGLSSQDSSLQPHDMNLLLLSTTLRCHHNSNWKWFWDICIPAVWTFWVKEMKMVSSLEKENVINTISEVQTITDLWSIRITFNWPGEDFWTKEPSSQLEW